MKEIVLTLLIVMGVVFSTLFGGIWFKEKFGVWNANVDRKIFNQSKSQIQGTIQALSTYRLEYKTSRDETHREALREMILLEYSAFENKDKLPYELRKFIEAL